MADGLKSPNKIVSSTEEGTAKRPLLASVRIGRGRGTDSVSTPHSHKFRVATTALAGIGLAAIVIAVALAASGSSGGTGPKWSSWKPLDGGNQGAQDIADHIAPFYRLSGTDQLDVITVMNLTSPSTVSSATTTASASNGLEVAVRPNTFSSQISLLSGKTVAYNLCGIGSTNCTIGIGTPSSDRLLLLRREALELALYTFKYIGGVNNVVAVLPPGRPAVASRLTAKPPSQNGKTSSPLLNTAVLFVKPELTPWLNQPLNSTLQEFPPGAAVPQLALWHQTPEAGLVDQITARGLFSEKLVNAQDGSNLLVLDPLPPQ
jgi:hypothetical protein